MAVWPGTNSLPSLSKGMVIISFPGKPAMFKKLKYAWVVGAKRSKVRLQGRKLIKELLNKLNHLADKKLIVFEECFLRID